MEITVDSSIEFKRELTNLIKDHGIDILCNTPDIFLVEYVIDVLESLRKVNDNMMGYDLDECDLRRESDGKE